MNTKNQIYDTHTHTHMDKHTHTQTNTHTHTQTHTHKHSHTHTHRQTHTHTHKHTLTHTHIHRQTHTQTHTHSHTHTDTHKHTHTHTNTQSWQLGTEFVFLNAVYCRRSTERRTYVCTLRLEAGAACATRFCYTNRTSLGCGSAGGWSRDLCTSPRPLGPERNSTTSAISVNAVFIHITNIITISIYNYCTENVSNTLYYDFQIPTTNFLSYKINK